MITREQMRIELRKMVESPAWPELSVWFTEVLVRRVLRSQNPIAAGAQASNDLAGAAALMLAIENELEQNNGSKSNTRGIPTRAERASGPTSGGAADDQEKAGK